MIRINVILPFDEKWFAVVADKNDMSEQDLLSVLEAKARGAAREELTSLANYSPDLDQLSDCVACWRSIRREELNEELLCLSCQEKQNNK